MQQRGGSEAEDPLIVLDRLASLYEELESWLARLAPQGDERERCISRGEFYQVYVLTLRMGDLIAELRRSIFQYCWSRSSDASREN